MTEHKKVFILAKTYPQPSKKYLELVCTAGILEDGTWIRLYPVPFRQLETNQKYKKYTWIDVEVEKNTTDPRIESYRPVRSSIMIDAESEFHKVNGKVNWEERKHIILDSQAKVYTNLPELIKEAYDTDKSLAVFKPTEIISLDYKPCGREWEKDKIEFIEAQRRQLRIYITQEEINYEMELVQKIPYKFIYTFKDDEGKKRRLTIIDWEIGMLYLNCMHRHNNEEKAIQDVKKKYENFAKTKDVYFFLGTTKKWHIRKARNPFMIIGVFYPPFSHNEGQLTLDF